MSNGSFPVARYEKKVWVLPHINRSTSPSEGDMGTEDSRDCNIGHSVPDYKMHLSGNDAKCKNKINQQATINLHNEIQLCYKNDIL